jgi:hypothetical protein
MIDLRWLAVGVPTAIAVTWRWRVHEQQEEEEKLTTYENAEATGRAGNRPDPRLNGWEYKIVRARWNAFRDPARFAKLCAEESQAGWVLLEKLDNRRIRFKRPLALRDLVKAEQLPFDPYRTEYGPVLSWRRLAVAIAFVAAIVVPAYVGYRLVADHLAAPPPPAKIEPPASPASVTPISPPVTNPPVTNP